MTTYWRHANYADVKRRSTEILSNDGEPTKLGFLQYYFDGKDHGVSPKKTTEIKRKIGSFTVQHQGNDSRKSKKCSRTNQDL